MQEFGKKIIRACLVFAVFCCAPAVVNGEDLEHALIFKADYTRSQTEFGARKAGGNAFGRLLYEAEYMVDNELMATIDHGPPWKRAVRPSAMRAGAI